MVTAYHENRILARIYQVPKVITLHSPTVTWKCSKCNGSMNSTDRVVISGTDIKAFHLVPGCSKYTGKEFGIDIYSNQVEEIRHLFRILKSINQTWAIIEICEIAKMDITPSYHGDHAELNALFFLIILFEQDKDKQIFYLIEEIASQALRDDIKNYAMKWA